METWKTKDGRIIPVNELADDHLINIVKYMHKRGFVSFFSWMKAYIFTLAPRAVPFAPISEEERKRVKKMKRILGKKPSKDLDTILKEGKRRCIQYP